MQRRAFNTNMLALMGSAALPMAARAQDKTTINWWYESASPENKEHLANLVVGPYNSANPDFNLNIDYRGRELDKQLRIAMLSGDVPDIVYTAGPSYVASMAKAGHLLPLDAYAEQLNWDDRILKLFMDLGRYDGTLYALPKTYETLGMFYDKKVFEKNGWAVPTKIAELEELAEEMIGMGLTPFGCGNADFKPFNEHYISIVFNVIAGPENFHKALMGEIPFTAEPFVEATNKLNEWWQKGYFGNYLSLGGQEGFAQVASGAAGIAPTGTWAFQWMTSYYDGVEKVPGFASFPTAEGVDAPLFPLGVGSTISISSKSEQADAAARVLDHLFTQDFYEKINSVWQGEWNTPLRDLSSVKVADDVPDVYIDTMRDLASAVDNNRYGYTTWTFLPPETNTYCYNGIEEVWLGGISVQQYLEEFNAIFAAELADGKVPTVPPRA